MAERKAPRKLDADELYEYAVKSLAARAQSVSELRQKLLRRASEGVGIDQILYRLKENGYLNDQRFAESFANLRRENRGFGKVRVLMDLKQRRVAPNLAAEAVSKAFEGKDEKNLIEQFLERRYRHTALNEYLTEEKNLAAVYRRLRRAGFSHGNTIGVLLRHAKEAAKLEEMTPPDEPQDST